MALAVKNLPDNAGDMGSIPGSGRSPSRGHGIPLQYSCLENLMDKEPGGLQSMGSQEVGHDRANKQQQFIIEGEKSNQMSTNER